MLCARTRVRTRAGTLTLLAAAALAGCGGFDTEGVEVAGRVVDGPLSGVVVCLDVNANRTCDDSEPRSEPTGPDGRYRLDVPDADAGLHPIIAVVPPTAVDADTGRAVGVPLVLQAPATGVATAQEVFVSPLTTLVAEVMTNQGVDAATAATQVQTALNLTTSPLADFLAAGDRTAAATAATLQAVTVSVIQLATAAGTGTAQATALASAIAQTDLASLAARVSAAVADTSLTPAQIAAQVSTAVVTDRNLTTATVVAAGTVAQQIATAPPAAETTATALGPFVSPRNFTYTDAQNYSYRLFTGDNSRLSATGSFAVNEVRLTRTGGVEQPFNRNTAYWTGSAWSVCERAWQVVSVTPATATTPQRSRYCGASVSDARIASASIAGRRMADVVAEMRAFPLPDGAAGLPTAWGPNPALLGDAVFPAGSELSTREQVSDIGGTERYGLTDKPRVVPASGTGTFRHAATFDDLRRMSGPLAGAAPAGGANTVFVDDIVLAQQPADTTIEARQRWRVALSPTTDAARFYRCDVRRSDQSSVNCTATGDARFAIETRGDGRVLRFTEGYPAALTAELWRQRQFVERDGVVFNGFRDLPRTSHHQRLNGTAWAALRTQLGIPAHAEPVAPAATGPFEQLRSFTFTDRANFNARQFKGNSALVDAQGSYTVTESRTVYTGGVLQPNVRGVLFWDGAQWYDCPAPASEDAPAPTVISQSSAAPFTSVYCRSFVDERVSRSVVTLDGRSVADVVRDIRWYPSLDGTFSYANWGPNPDAAGVIAAGATFPAGSTMEYRVSRRVATPYALNLGDTARVRLPPANPASLPASQWPLATTLADAVAAFGGDLRGSAVNGATTLFVHEWTPAIAPVGYAPRVQVRAAFDPATSRVRMYRFNIDATTNGLVNPVAVLDTPYTIETVGDARVLRYAAMPAGFEAELGFARIVVERSGEVRYGTKDTAGTLGWSIRLNGPATQGLSTALGLD